MNDPWLDMSVKLKDKVGQVEAVSGNYVLVKWDTQAPATPYVVLHINAKGLEFKYRSRATVPNFQEARAQQKDNT